MYTYRPQKQRRVASVRGRVVLAVLAVTGLALMYLTLHVYIILLERSITQIRNNHRQAEARVDALVIEAAALSTGTRIKAIARDQLGMILPEGLPQKLF